MTKNITITSDKIKIVYDGNVMPISLSRKSIQCTLLNDDNNIRFLYEEDVSQVNLTHLPYVLT